MTDSIKGALQHLAASVSSSVRRNSAGPEQFGSAPLHHVSSDVDLRALPADSTAAAAAASGSSSEQLPSMSSPLPGGSASGDDNTAFSTVPLSSATSQQAAYARILDDLPNKAEWSSLAHRGTIDPMQQTQYAAQPPSADSSLSAAAASSGSAARPLFRKTGIICTIGPGTNSPSALADLRKAGMNIMRMNFSHGDHAYHQSAIDNLRKSFDVYPGPPVAVALDTKGPEIRTGTMRVGEVELKAGNMITVSVDPEHKTQCDERLVYMDYTNLPLIVQRGSLIYVDDGLISLRVDSVADDKRSCQCTIINTGKLSSKKGVNLPGLKVDLPSISEQDAKDLAFGVEQGVDIVFASFIRKRDDIVRIRQVLGERGKRIMIIAKIENQEGVQNFNAILSECDGVMVARGDLGIEIPVQKVFLAQKMMIARCNIVGKPVICATQMLESMTVNPRPTRAEVSDVGNAVIDGADCVMLSGETAKGKYPNECVRMMHEIGIEAERTLHHLAFFQQVHSLNKNKHTNETLASAAVNASFEQDVQALIVLSVSGNTARLVAKYRPACPIICITTDQITSRQLHLTRGVYPVYCPLSFNPKDSSWAAFIDSMVTYGIAESQRKGERILNKNDIAIVVQGWTSHSGHTNTLRVIRI